MAGLISSGDTLYGTTSSGGADGYGTIFSVPVTGGIPTTLASFTGDTGESPQADLLLSGDTLYGTTSSGGGTNGYGTVFSEPLSGGTPTTLATFDISNGAHPVSNLLLSGNTLYGTTSSAGGSTSSGTVFSLPITGGTPTTLATFGLPNGESPVAGLTLVGTTLYGTTVAGGPGTSNAYGTVFSVPISGGVPTTLASFNGPNGSAPEAQLTLSGNTFYGTTSSGGAYGRGTVFSVPISGGAVTTLASFNSFDGDSPQGGLTLIGTTLYGTTVFGGAEGEGTLFSVPVNGGDPTTLVTFDYSNGAYPVANLTLIGDTLYGTTQVGGALDGTFGDGTVFSFELPDVPEPSAWALGLLGLSLILAARSRFASLSRS